MTTPVDTPKPEKNTVDKKIKKSHSDYQYSNT
jgi:hypothetical protein